MTGSAGGEEGSEVSELQMPPQVPRSLYKPILRTHSLSVKGVLAVETV